ncbi:MAG: Uma2 family endonuclease [Bacteroidota bacterium]
MPVVALPPLTTEAVLHRLSTADYHKMAEAGLFTPDSPRVELLNGQLITMSPVGNRHFYCVNELNWAISERVVQSGRRDLRVSVQNPIRLDDHSEPEPDVVLMDLVDHVPAPHEVHLVVEVSDSTLRYDQQIKRRHYAAAGIIEYWLVDLEGHAIWAYTDPAGDDYRQHQTYGDGEAIPLRALADAPPLPVTDVLPPPGSTPRSTASE